MNEINKISNNKDQSAESEPRFCIRCNFPDWGKAIIVGTWEETVENAKKIFNDLFGIGKIDLIEIETVREVRP